MSSWNPASICKHVWQASGLFGIKENCWSKIYKKVSHMNGPLLVFGRCPKVGQEVPRGIKKRSLHAPTTECCRHHSPLRLAAAQLSCSRQPKLHCKAATCSVFLGWLCARRQTPAAAAPRLATYHEKTTRSVILSHRCQSAFSPLATVYVIGQ